MQTNKKSAIKGLYPILDTSITPASELQKTASEIIGGGIHILQFRAEGFYTGDILKLSMKLRDLTEREGVTFVINNRVDIALIADADGVHLGQSDLPCREARKLLGEDKLIGVSTHNLREALKAVDDGADYVSFGPIFATTTKKDADGPKGVKRLKEIKDAVTVPVVAIGGINEGNIRDVTETGVDSVAMISDILKASDITGKIKKLRSIIDSMGITNVEQGMTK